MPGPFAGPENASRWKRLKGTIPSTGGPIPPPQQSDPQSYEELARIFGESIASGMTPTEQTSNYIPTPEEQIGQFTLDQSLAGQTPSGQPLPEGAQAVDNYGRAYYGPEVQGIGLNTDWFTSMVQGIIGRTKQRAMDAGQTAETGDQLKAHLDNLLKLMPGAVREGLVDPNKLSPEERSKLQENQRNEAKPAGWLKNMFDPQNFMTVVGTGFGMIGTAWGSLEKNQSAWVAIPSIAIGEGVRILGGLGQAFDNYVERILGGTVLAVKQGIEQKSMDAFWEDLPVTKDAWRASVMAYTGLVNYAQYEEFKREVASGKDPYLLRSFYENPAAEFVGQFIAGFLWERGPGRIGMNKMESVRQSKAAAWGVWDDTGPVARNISKIMYGEVVDPEGVRATRELAKAGILNEVRDTENLLTEAANTKAPVPLGRTLKNIFNPAERERGAFLAMTEGSKASFIAENVTDQVMKIYAATGGDEQQTLRYLITTALPYTGEADDLDRFVDLLMEFGKPKLGGGDIPSPGILWSKQGRLTGKVVYELLFKDGKYVGGDWIIKAIQESGGDLVKMIEAIEPRIRSQALELFPSILDKINESERAAAQAKKLGQAFVESADVQAIPQWQRRVAQWDNLVRKGIYSPANKFFAGIYMGLSPGYAARNMMSNFMHIFIDQGLGSLVRGPARAEELTSEWLGFLPYTTQRGLGGGPIGSAFESPWWEDGSGLKKVFTYWSRKSAEAEQRAAQMVVASSVDRHMKNAIPVIMRATRDLLDEAGMSEEMQRRLSRILIENKGNTQDAVSWMQESADNGYMDVWKSLANLTDDQIGALRNSGLLDLENEVLRALQGARTKDDWTKAVQGIKENLRIQARRAARDATGFTYDDEFVQDAGRVEGMIGDSIISDGQGKIFTARLSADRSAMDLWEQSVASLSTVLRDTVRDALVKAGIPEAEATQMVVKLSPDDLIGQVRDVRAQGREFADHRINVINALVRRIMNPETEIADLKVILADAGHPYPTATRSVTRADARSFLLDTWRIDRQRSYALNRREAIGLMRDHLTQAPLEVLDTLGKDPRIQELVTTGAFNIEELGTQVVDTLGSHISIQRAEAAEELARRWELVTPEMLAVHGAPYVIWPDSKNMLDVFEQLKIPTGLAKGGTLIPFNLPTLAGMARKGGIQAGIAQEVIDSLFRPERMRNSIEWTPEELDTLRKALIGWKESRLPPELAQALYSSPERMVRQGAGIPGPFPDTPAGNLARIASEQGYQGGDTEALRRILEQKAADLAGGEDAARASRLSPHERSVKYEADAFQKYDGLSPEDAQSRGVERATEKQAKIVQELDDPNSLRSRLGSDMTDWSKQPDTYTRQRSIAEFDKDLGAIHEGTRENPKRLAQGVEVVFQGEAGAIYRIDGGEWRAADNAAEQYMLGRALLRPDEVPEPYRFSYNQEELAQTILGSSPEELDTLLQEADRLATPSPHHPDIEPAPVRVAASADPIYGGTPTNSKLTAQHLMGDGDWLVEGEHPGNVFRGLAGKEDGVGIGAESMVGNIGELMLSAGVPPSVVDGILAKLPGYETFDRLTSDSVKLLVDSLEPDQLDELARTWVTRIRNKMEKSGRFKNVFDTFSPLNGVWIEGKGWFFSADNTHIKSVLEATGSSAEDLAASGLGVAFFQRYYSGPMADGAKLMINGIDETGPLSDFLDLGVNPWSKGIQVMIDGAENELSDLLFTGAKRGNPNLAEKARSIVFANNARNVPGPVVLRMALNDADHYVRQGQFEVGARTIMRQALDNTRLESGSRRHGQMLNIYDQLSPYQKNELINDLRRRMSTGEKVTATMVQELLGDANKYEFTREQAVEKLGQYVGLLGLDGDPEFLKEFMRIEDDLMRKVTLDNIQETIRMRGPGEFQVAEGFVSPDEVASWAVKELGMDPTIDPLTATLNPGVPPGPSMAAAENLDGYMNLMDQIHERMNPHIGRVEPFTMQAEQLKKLEAWQLRASHMMSEQKSVAAEVAKRSREFTLLNYEQRYGYDQALSYLYPYHFWYTRTYGNWLKRIAYRPQLLGMYAAYREYMQKIHAGQPDWWKYNINTNELSMGLLDSDNPMYFNFEQSLNPLQGLFGTDFENPEKTKEWWGAAVDAMGKWGPTVWTPFQIAVATAYSFGMNDKTAGAATAGRLFPQSAAVRAAFALAGADVEIDPFVHVFGGGQEYFEQRRIGRQLSVMQQNKEITAEQANDAAYSREGEIWDKAKMATLQARAPGQIASSLLGTGFKGRRKEEIEIDQFFGARNALLAQRGGMTPEEYRLGWDQLRRQYPFMDSLLLSRKQDSERDSALVYTVMGRIPPGQQSTWNEWANIPDSLMDKFYESKGNFEDWSKSDVQRIMAGTLDLAAVLATPDDTTQMEWSAVRADRRKMDGVVTERFGTDIEIMIDTYYAIKQSNPDQATALLEAFPAIENALDFRSAYILNHPVLRDYYGGVEVLERYYKSLMYDDARKLFGEDIFELQTAYFFVKEMGGNASGFLRATSSQYGQHRRLTTYWDWLHEQQAITDGRVAELGTRIGEIKEAKIREDIMSDAFGVQAVLSGYYEGQAESGSPLDQVSETVLQYMGDRASSEQVRVPTATEFYGNVPYTYIERFFSEATRYRLKTYFEDGLAISPMTQQEMLKVWNSMGKPGQSFSGWLHMLRGQYKGQGTGIPLTLDNQ